MRYVCQICGYIYDDDKEPIPFASLPADWKCPICKAGIADFAALSEEDKNTVTEQAPGAFAREPYDADAEKLSAGQLAALCSNLARGCEKQYKAQEALLFTQLADYFTAAMPAVEDATVERIARALQSDIAEYPSVRSVADAAEDRGAARICVWGEKVTRMLSSLVTRYLEEGESLLEGTNIWVCSVCGFVYIGDEPPKLCPVCKVPDWKFNKIEGRA